MTETQQRFLKAIAERVTGDNVTEIRLYPTVRVGPIESGVAIVATKEPMPVAVAEEQVSAEGDLTVGEIRIACARTDRLSILTAHFRHTVKGPDRGKWVCTLVHDDTVGIEVVVRRVRVCRL